MLRTVISIHMSNSELVKEIAQRLAEEEIPESSEQDETEEFVSQVLYLEQEIREAAPDEYADEDRVREIPPDETEKGSGT